MRFYYTGAKSLFGEQKSPSLSLGGFISSSVVPNSSLGNLFSSISPYTKDKNLDEYIMLALKNELSNNIKDLKISFLNSNPDLNIGILEIAAIKNTNGNFEKIINSTSAPYFAEFFSATTEVCIGDLKSGEYLGIWIKRKIDKTAYSELFSTASLIVGTYKDTNKEDIQLKMNWVNL